MSKTVIYARLHQGVHLPGAGSLGEVFPPQSKTLEGLTMAYDGANLSIDFIYRGIKKHVVVPGTNVSVMECVPPAEAQVLDKKGK